MDCVASDVCGPFQHLGFKNEKYIVTFIDLRSKYAKVYPIIDKSANSVFEKFMEFYKFPERMTERKLKFFRTDNGTEYVNDVFSKMFKHTQILHQTTIPGTPQQNGCAERLNRSLLDRTRTTLAQSGLPIWCWSEIIQAQLYMKNNLPRCRAKGEIPSAIFFNQQHKKPNISHCRVLGCLGYVKLLTPEHKISDRSAPMFLVGYPNNKKGYLMWEPMKNIITISRDVDFHEHIMFRDTSFALRFGIQPDLSAPTWEEKFNLIEGETMNRSDIEHARATIIKSFWPISKLRDENYEGYKEAITKEMEAHRKFNTWKTVPKTTNMKTIGTQWILGYKTNAENKIVKYKARLVARGDQSIPGLHFEDTFSPTLSKSALRMLLPFCVSKNYLIHQIDIATAFINAKVDKEIFITLPDLVYTEEFRKNNVGLLLRSLYGLKQAPLIWYKTLVKALNLHGFSSSDKESCIFKREYQGDLQFLGIYVDDIIISAKTITQIEQIKSVILKEFDIVDLGKLHEILGWCVELNDTSLILKQTGYIEKIQDQYKIEVRKRRNPMKTETKFQEKLKEGIIERQTEFQQKIGSLLYVVGSTRPDLSYSVNYMSRFMSRPSNEHHEAVNRIF